MSDRPTDIGQFVEWFRHSSPYINTHRGRTFVIYIAGGVVDSPAYVGFMHDLALLNSLGVRVVLVHGAEPQIDAQLDSTNITTQRVDGLRITDQTVLGHVKSVVGSLRMDIETLLSMGLPNSPMTGLRVQVASGNFVTAKPLGVLNGIDFHHTGEVRRIDVKNINKRLDDGNIVLMSPIGYSPSGEIFSIGALHMATETAIAIQADKYLIVSEGVELHDADGHIIYQMNLREAEHRLKSMADENDSLKQTFAHAVNACQKGVERVHLLDQDQDGVLLLELFTRDGAGTLINSGSYDNIRQASNDDIGGILELIEPMEIRGILVRRSRERLETEIQNFTIMERDGMITACAALYPFEDEHIGELACLAVHTDYHKEGRGASLLAIIEQQAIKKGLERLFVLTSQTAHWFIERGFVPAEIDELPMSRQYLYNYQRKSKVFIKPLHASSKANQS